MHKVFGFNAKDLRSQISNKSSIAIQAIWLLREDNDAVVYIMCEGQWHEAIRESVIDESDWDPGSEYDINACLIADGDLTSLCPLVTTQQIDSFQVDGKKLRKRRKLQMKWLKLMRRLDQVSYRHGIRINGQKP